MNCVYLVSCRPTDETGAFSTVAVCATVDAAKKWVVETLEWVMLSIGWGRCPYRLGVWRAKTDCDGEPYIHNTVEVNVFPFEDEPALELKITRRYVIE